MVLGCRERRRLGGGRETRASSEVEVYFKMDSATGKEADHQIV
jgi:hypothetical protein